MLIAHGVQKLFGWLGGAGLTGTADAFEQMGFRPGLPSAVAAGVGGAGGGALIVLGLFTPAAGAAAAGTMIPAAAVHAPKGFFATGGGYEYPALLGLSAAALALTGPGDWSLDARLGHGLNPPWMVAATLLASAAASALVLQHRRKALTAQDPAPAAPAVAGNGHLPDGATTPSPKRTSLDQPSSGCPGGTQAVLTGLLILVQLTGAARTALILLVRGLL